jgi:hypothetical protein
MGNIIAAAAAVGIFVQILILSTVSPAIAISADLAKRCREMAIKSHPPAPAGTTPYAQAERDFFRNCISKSDDAKDKGGNGTQKAPSAGPL